VEQIMGMPISIHLRGPRSRVDGDAAVTEAITRTFAHLREVEARFSPFRADSELNRLNRGDLDWAGCHPDLHEVAELCERAAETTAGWFTTARTLPDGSRVFDPIGLVKGWAVQRAARHLDGLTDHDHTVNAGGDVVARCHRTDTPDWRIGIEDPRDTGRILLAVPVRTGAVATSGTAARGGHIRSPESDAPADGLASATVFGPDLTWADAYATAAFAHGPGARSWLGDLPDHAAVLVDPFGGISTIP
jgi:thiamine biosynthesis lipoprotein